MSTKTYRGSCHCKAIRFEVDLDLALGSGKCNCSFCAKARNWSTVVKPEAFRLLAGGDDTHDYMFGSCSVHHLFCKHCGMRPYGHGVLEALGGAYVSVAIACLDDLTPAELTAIPVTYYDGLHNNWWNPPAETRYL
ncbi:MAG: GFA family protein [Polyangiales bacterium]